MKQLSGLDASFLYFETPKVPGHIFNMWIYDQSTAPKATVTFKGILAHIEAHLDVSPIFRQKLLRVPFDLDHPYWVDDPDFDLEYHVRHIALPHPGDWRQLCIQVARLHSRALDLSKPLWETYVIEGLDNVEGLPKGSFAVMQKTHHAAVDGVTMLEITSAVHDLAPDAPARELSSSWKPEPTPPDWTLLGRAMWNNTMRPMRFAQTVARSLPGADRMEQQFLQRRLDIPPMASAPRTRFSGAVSGHRVFEGRRYELDEVRRIKSAVGGATVNDAMTAIVAGGLRRYLDSKGELPAESLRVMMPISVRSDDQKGAAGNQVSGMVASMGTHIADPRERLEHVRDSTHQSKQFAQAIDAGALQQISDLMPGGLASMGARLAAQFELATSSNPVVNCVVSNVPGPNVPLYFAGAQLVAMYGGAQVADGMGLLHGILSSSGGITISVNSDRDMMPDPRFYGDCLDESFEEMVRATR